MILLNFHLDLFECVHLHQVFHVALLEPWVATFILDCVILPPPPIQLVKGLEYNVKDISHSTIMW
jgi:hypothetical protein